MKRFKVDKYGQIPLIQESSEGDDRWSVRAPFVIVTFMVMAIALIIGIIHFR
jgi:hypothetical protein